MKKITELTVSCPTCSDELVITISKKEYRVEPAIPRKQVPQEHHEAESIGQVMGEIEPPFTFKKR